MKNKQQSDASAVRPNQGKRPLSKTKATHRKAYTKRPLHRTITFHPASVLALVCVGVLLVTFTLNVFAGSYNVTAVVPAPPLTQPAIITSPTDGAQLTTQAITVSGTCPDNSYVNLMNNGNFVGSSICSSGGFQVGLDLAQGSNVLQAQDYNVTNAPGPASGTVTVTYTPQTSPNTGGGGTTTAPPSAVVTPTQLIVTQVDNGVPYIQNATQVVSQRPTIAGVAPSYSHIVIVMHPGVVTCSTYATAQGYWRCTLPSDLLQNTYTVEVTATTPQGAILVHTPFSIQVGSGVSVGTKTPAPFMLTSSYAYSAHPIGQSVDYTIHISGGEAPYVFTISWGDGVIDTFVRENSADFTISHIYSWINAPQALDTTKVQGIDTVGQNATLQFSTLIRNHAYHSVVANITRRSGLWGLFGAIRPWLWVVWPGYSIIVLLIFSFWLGEREELARLNTKESLQLMKRKRHHAHVHR